MYCSRCGVENSDSATVCVNCNAPLIGAVAQPAAAPARYFAEPQTSGLAIASLVMGILSLFCSLFMAIPAIICGIIALVKISKSQGQLKGNGFAIAGIAVPVTMTVVITPLLLAILMPALSKAKQMAASVVCETNLQALSNGMTVYMDDYDGEYPTPEQWCDLLIQEADLSPKVFQCLESPGMASAYAMNENLKGLNDRMTDYVTAGQMVVLFEADLGKNGVGGLDDVVLRHDLNGQIGCNIVFADGHVEFITADQLENLQWTFRKQ